MSAHLWTCELAKVQEKFQPCGKRTKKDNDLIGLCQLKLTAMEEEEVTGCARALLSEKLQEDHALSCPGIFPYGK